MERIVLEASEGMLLTNGEVYATRLELGDWDSPNKYREITMDEYNAILQREENREIYDM
jgi:hypothetical protein